MTDAAAATAPSPPGAPASPGTATHGAPTDLPDGAGHDGARGDEPWAEEGWRSVRRAPLLPKIVVADLVINVLSYVVVRNARVQYADEIMIASLFVTLVLNAALVYWALLPLRVLEVTAGLVARGDLSARVPPSRLADRNIARIGTTFNRVLDTLAAERGRVRSLAAQVIRAGDAERAHIARELHDSTAQQLSALEMLVSASAKEGVPGGGPLGERLVVMHDIVTEALREVRTLSHTVHPRVLDDLGLVAALETLARRTRDQSAGVAVHVHSTLDRAVPAPVASVLYRVAQEALRNAVRHAGATRIDLRVSADGPSVRLEVVDDGAGFDVGAAQAARGGLGLFVMQERVSLVDGTLAIKSRPGAGTRVIAAVPWGA